MKRIFYIFAILIVSVKLSFSQVYPFVNDYPVNPVLLNPALVATYNYLNINLSTFRLFALPNAPSHYSLTVSKRYFKMGGSLQILKQGSGPWNNYNLGGSYFYEVKFNYRLKAAFSLSSYLQFNQLDRNQIQGNQNDPVLANYQWNRNLQFGFGSILYSKDWVLGFSIANLMRTRTFIKMPTTYIFLASYFYKHPINLYYLNTVLISGINRESIYLEPEAIFYLKKVLKIGGAVNLQYYFNGKLYPKASIITGLNVGNRLYFTYVAQYDFIAANIFLARWHLFLSLNFKIINHKQDIPRFF